MNEQDLFLQVMKLPDAAGRQHLLDRECHGNPQLRQRVELLLRAHDQAGKFLESPAAGSVATLDHFPATEEPGTVIGRYKLLEQIGEGGMGVVYVAEQTEPVRRRVALKIIKPGMDSRQVIARFEAERQALAMMDHPNIAKILDAGTVGQSTKSEARSTKRIQNPKKEIQNEEHLPVSNIGPSNLEFVSDFELRASNLTAGRLYFVMELVRGMPITEYCEQTRLPVRQRLELFVDVCQAVQHAHQKGIIHRDLKPSNVLITLHDGTPVVKVIDFGVAKAIGQQLTDSTIYTAHAQLVGTPLYMSPEQAELSGLDVDTRSDVYSLGVLLYELLTGTTPFDKDRLKSVGFDEMRRIIREEEPETVSARIARTQSSRQTPSAVNPKSKIQNLKSFSELDWITARALEKDRTRRYESPSSLAADLTRYLSGDLVHACPPSALYRFRKFARKNKTALTTTAIVAISLLLGTGVSIWQALRAIAAEAQATANEAQAKQAAAAEANERGRAEANEQKALAAAAAERTAKESEAVQRKQVEKNFATALEAVDRMLEHVADPELNGAPRVGPLRRKMLKDAIAFYERIPLQTAVNSQARYRIAQTWERIARMSWDLDEYEQARRAGQTAIAMFNQLVKEVRNNSGIRRRLADSQIWAGRLNSYHFRNHGEAEKLFRNAELVYAGLAQERPEELNWFGGQASSLRYLSEALTGLGKKDEAMGCLNRALDLAERAKALDSPLHGQILGDLGWLHLSEANPSECDRLFRQSIEIFRKHWTGEKASKSERQNFAHTLRSYATRGDFAVRQSAEAEKMLEESIAILREYCGLSPAVRYDGIELAYALQAQSEALRRRASRQPGDGVGGNASELITRANALYEESLVRQRQVVARFALPGDQFELVKAIHKEAEYVLSQLGGQPSDAAARNLRADALLTEAIQLCRALAAKFPDNPDYKSRLDALLKLQAQHFSQKTQPDPAQSSEPPK